MTSSAGRAGPAAMTRPWRRYSGWMMALFASVCAHCGEPIAEGQWQGLAVVPGKPGEGTRWVHEACALELGPAGDPQRPEHDRGVPPDPATAPEPEPEPLRILVLGSSGWPRERAVEVRDAIAALARGHSRVTLVHAARRAADTGQLAGVDAWAELTAERLGYHVEHYRGEAATHADVVVAFPLADDPATTAAIARAQRAGLAVLTHTS